MSALNPTTGEPSPLSPKTAGNRGIVEEPFQ